MSDKKKENKGDALKLLKPFDFEGEEITEVTLSRPTGRDMIQAEQEVKASRSTGYQPGQAELQLFMLARALRQPIEFVEAMAAADIGVLMEKIDTL